MCAHWLDEKPFFMAAMRNASGLSAYLGGAGALLPLPFVFASMVALILVLFSPCSLFVRASVCLVVGAFSILRPKAPPTSDSASRWMSSVVLAERVARQRLPYTNETTSLASFYFATICVFSFFFMVYDSFA